MSICLLVVKSFHLKIVLPHVKSYFHKARQNNHFNKLTMKFCQCQVSVQDVSHVESEVFSLAFTTSQTVVTIITQKILFRNPVWQEMRLPSYQFLDWPQTSHSLRWRFWSVQKGQSYKELNLTEFSTWCVSQNR